MELNIYTMFDSAANAFMAPFFTQTDGQALRMVQNTVNNESEDNNINKNPEQFVLYKIGVFNDNTATIEAYEAPQKIVSARELLDKEKVKFTKTDAQNILDKLDIIEKQLPSLLRTQVQ